MSEVFTQIDNLTLARSGRVFAAIGRIAITHGFAAGENVPRA
jgi:hypothetical protein